MIELSPYLKHFPWNCSVTASGLSLISESSVRFPTYSMITTAFWGTIQLPCCTFCKCFALFSVVDISVLM